MNRRSLLCTTVWTSVACMAASSRLLGQPAPGRQFTIDLCPGRIGVNATQPQAIDLAAEFGFESVEPFGSYLADLSPGQLADLQSELQAKHLVWGAAGLSVEFRKDDATFAQGMAQLPQLCAGLQRAGVTRVGTWLRPSHEQLTYLANFRQHAVRLRQVATVLNAHGLRLGLEYVGPRTSRSKQRYAFIHTMVETKELLAEIGTDNVGLVLDSWHWYTAEEDVAALRTLSNQDVVAVDLNDAPAGLPVQDQIDNRRELPVATGVIDVKAFLEALVAIGYDGPVRAEPFNQPLNALDDRSAVEATALAMKQAVGLIG
jgi:sugar phosphate isomerase/epimerase